MLEVRNRRQGEAGWSALEAGTKPALVNGGQVHVHVSDTGVGIPAAKLSSIFEPFVQVKSGFTRDHDGVGLGLAISRDLARMMRGDLTVTSTLGAGSRFTLTLPRRSE